MYNNNIELLNLKQFNLQIQSFTITKIGNILYCYITLKKQIESCVHCGCENIVVKEYKVRKITHSISNNNPCFIMYKARRYKCKLCDSTFYERNPFASPSARTSIYTRFAVLEDLKNHTATFSSVAKRLNLSVNTVINIFDAYVDAKRRSFPEVICIDEFYTSKSSDYKYACVFFDFHAEKIIDVFSSRKKYRLGKQISLFPKTERNKVKYAVIDMWDTYKKKIKTYFPNASIAVDSFHVIKNLNNAMNIIKIKTMKKYDKRTNKLIQSDMYYYMLKKFHYFFTKNFDNIFDGKINIPKMGTK